MLTELDLRVEEDIVAPDEAAELELTAQYGSRHGDDHVAKGRIFPRVVGEGAVAAGASARR